MKLDEFKANYEINRKGRGVRADPINKVPEGKIHKYSAKKTAREINGVEVMFPSIREAKTYDKLALMERAGVLTELIVNSTRSVKDQVKFIFQTKPFKMYYVPDFCYWDVAEKRYVIADSKGFRTTVYKKKRRLMKEMFGIEILEY